jgi:hypothetical protein
MKTDMDVKSVIFWSAISSAFFGVWQDSFFAGLWMTIVMMFFITACWELAKIANK